jgi:hypothetical protein
MTNDHAEDAAGPVDVEDAGIAVGPGRAPASDARALDVDDPVPQPLSSAEYSVAFSPRSVAIGLAIVAGLVAFALSRRRRAGTPPTDEVD